MRAEVTGHIRKVTEEMKDNPNATSGEIAARLKNILAVIAKVSKKIYEFIREVVLPVVSIISAFL